MNELKADKNYVFRTIVIRLNLSV